MSFQRLFILILALGFPSAVHSQEIKVSVLYVDSLHSEIIYKVYLQNTSEDSIMVLHAQQASLPPFINSYKWEKSVDKSKTQITVFMGRSDNPYLPEKYRATKTLIPQEQLELYFRLRNVPAEPDKKLLVYFSMLSGKYANDFHLLEKTGTDAALRRCQNLKQKHGVVHKKSIPF